MGVSTFGTFTMARLGIYASNQGLNVTGQNISNINTEGYTRQALEQQSMNMGGSDRYQSTLNLRIGSGVFVTDISQMRDKYLDIRYRDEVASVGYMDARMDGLNQLSTIIDEVGDGVDSEGVLEAQFNDVVEQMNNLAAQGAGKDRYDTLFRTSMSSLIDEIHETASSLDRLKSNLTQGLQDDIDDCNTILLRIRDLNEEIHKTNLYGGNALEVKDERNVMIDKLAEYMKINVTYSMEEVSPGLEVEKLTITTGTPPTERTLVDGSYATQIVFRPEMDEDGNVTGDHTGNFDLDFEPLRDRFNRPLRLQDVGEPVSQMGNEPARDPDTGEEYTGLGQEAADAIARRLQEAADEDPDKSNYLYAVVKDPVENEGDIQTYSVRELTQAYATQGQAEAAAAAMQHEDTTINVYDEADEQLGVEAGWMTKNIYEAVYVPADADTGIPAHYEVLKQEVFQGAVELGDTELYGKLLADREVLTKKGVFSTDEDLALDPSADSKRGLPFYRMALDALANNLATVLNDANTLPDETVYKMVHPAVVDDSGNVQIGAVYQGQDGKEYKDMLEITQYVDESGNVYDEPQTDEEGRLITKPQIAYVDIGSAKKGRQVFYNETDRIVAERDQLQLNEGYEFYTGGVLLSNHGNGNDTTGINASNISVSKNWANGSMRVLRTKDPKGAEDSTLHDNLDHILNLLTNPLEFTAIMGNPELADKKADGGEKVFFTGTFQELFTNHMAGSLAGDQAVTETLLGNYENSRDELYVDRDSVMGVDLNDETMNLMMYQRSYQAACRLLTTFDTMLDKLINGTAV